MAVDEFGDSALVLPGGIDTYFFLHLVYDIGEKNIGDKGRPSQVYFDEEAGILYYLEDFLLRVFLLMRNKEFKVVKYEPNVICFVVDRNNAGRCMVKKINPNEACHTFKNLDVNGNGGIDFSIDEIKVPDVSTWLYFNDTLIVSSKNSIFRVKDREVAERKFSEEIAFVDFLDSEHLLITFEGGIEIYLLDDLLEIEVKLSVRCDDKSSPFTPVKLIGRELFILADSMLLVTRIPFVTDYERSDRVDITSDLLSCEYQQ
ncbi:uncharacterized protein LOC108666095 isoform X3 [Hyalella azteca]|uniref:Uncharacterized protein LOC108666095 isoform X3 n=1 Tax=Hyalella azteca TaxID=294128 RepID=A0A979FGZ3_HYAAZ|nr:uncharacterized protein LOC108666095 isoform X3 [Hyalella azteca]